ncbi:MAG: putative bifunctional DNA primase/polymerase [Prokaryotic dsDNA virus sp.]|nr:MAG: putative bifunctional DNA primase/polymerase [Prokaryotic dsDNA virus sp.]|tara:strand:+ start:334 stop:2097 length:1764 start_codon:yes stop_codon:yes gene_type:complete
MDINGYEIKDYNIFKLDTRAKKSTCPKCSHTRKKKSQKCLMLDWDRGLGTCQHCGEVLQLHTYEKSKENDYVVPVIEKTYKPTTNVLDWFISRGISKETLQSCGVTAGVEYMPQVSKDVKVIMFNYIYNNTVVNVKYRDSQKNFKLYKGARKMCYNMDSIVDSDTCIVTEGEIDCLSFVECGRKNVVSVPNGFTASGQVNLDYLNDFYYHFENKKRIYICVDSDEAGENGKKELIRRFGSEKVYLCDLKDCKDANEYLLKYGKDALFEVIDDATPCPIENVLRVSDMVGELDDFYKNGIKNGFKIGLDSFDGIFSTYTKQFIVVTGFPSSGKSDFVDQMTIGYNMMYDWKTAYASTENYPQYLHVDKLVRKIYGNTPKYEETKKKEWKKCVEHINKNFFFIDYEDGFDLDKVLKKGEELVRRVGIRCLVIDPYNKIRDKNNLNLSITDYTNGYLNKVDTFCKKNDVICIIVAHPTKPQNDKGKLIEPTFYDVKGGGEFYDMSPHGILVHRDYENATVKVKVLKVKFANLGENQAHTQLSWNVNNGRYTEMDNGNVSWDNTNWMEDKNNPYEVTKTLDLEFEQLNINK